MLSKDAINTALGLSPGDPLYQLRASRPAFVNGSEASRAAVLQPEDDLGLSGALRHAIAHRAAAFGENPALLAGYPAPKADEFQELANGGMPQDPRLAAVARHTDMITAKPAEASEADLHSLLAAGFSVPQIIALSELLAQVCFEMRIVHGLSLLRDNANA